MYYSYAESINYSQLKPRGTPLAGQETTVGIVDSLCGCSEHLQDELKISSCVCHYTDTEKDDPTGHGTAVLGSFTPIADECEFKFFQALEDHSEGQVRANNEKTKGRRSDILEAVTDAVAGGVDILNLSLGIAHNCRGFCSLAREVKTAVSQDNVSVIAAAGNQGDDGETRGVHCPALCENVVSVAGYVSHCEHEPTDEQSSGQWWLRGDDEGDIFGPFCGWRFCERGPVGSCSENRRESSWGGNVQFYNGFPDIAAPVICVSRFDDGTVGVQVGTSFAAPIVAAVVSVLRSHPQYNTGEPTPAEMQAAIRETSSLLDDESELRKLDCEALFASFLDTEMDGYS